MRPEPAGANRSEARGAGHPPLVSCIIIFLNEELYLREAIASVMAQSYGDWELLLVDDGSTDRSSSIARDYCTQFPEKMIYLRHENGANRGMSASRNLGLHRARGTYVAFLDGDDWWYPDKLERQVAMFAANPRAIMVCGATTYWHSWQPNTDLADRIVHVGERRARDRRPKPTVDQDRLYAGEELLPCLYPLGRGATPSSSGNMYRLDAALTVGGYDDSFRGLFEDQVFRTKIYLHGHVFVSSEVFDRYRQHAESCFQLAKATGQSTTAQHRFLIWLKDYLSEVGHRRLSVRLRLWRLLARSEFPRVRGGWTFFSTQVRRVMRGI